MIRLYTDDKSLDGTEPISDGPTAYAIDITSLDELVALIDEASPMTITVDVSGWYILTTT